MRAILFLIAALLALARVGLDVFGPSYYAPESVLDYVAVLLMTMVLSATGVALVELFRSPLVSRGAWLTLFPAGGAIVAGLGNLLEDGFGVESAVWAFFVGSVTMVFGLVIAGVAILTVRSPWRWTGLALIAGGVGYGMGDAGLLLFGIVWLTFAVVLIFLRPQPDPGAVRFT